MRILITDILHVLNLIINGLPSKLIEYRLDGNKSIVLNLIINGLPSKQILIWKMKHALSGFKPYYKWITF